MRVDEAHDLLGRLGEDDGPMYTREEGVEARGLRLGQLRWGRRGERRGGRPEEREEDGREVIARNVKVVSLVHSILKRVSLDMSCRSVRFVCRRVRGLLSIHNRQLGFKVVDGGDTPGS